MVDVILLATAFGATRGTEKYNAAYDLNNDGAINMADVLIIAENFNKTIDPSNNTQSPSSTPTPVPSTATRILPAVDSVEKTVRLR
jgi:endo-1,4-beta-xylanase